MPHTFNLGFLKLFYIWFSILTDPIIKDCNESAIFSINELLSSFEDDSEVEEDNLDSPQGTEDLDSPHCTEDENNEIAESNKSRQIASASSVVNKTDKKKSKPKPTVESKTKVSTELARRMLQKNLERLLLNQTESCKDVISQLTGTMTAKQVEKLVEKTNLELEQGSKINKSSSQASQRMYLFSKEIWIETNSFTNCYRKSRPMQANQYYVSMNSK